MYDSFGNITPSGTISQPFTYTAREYDTETGLYFYRARYYDPKAGRFLQRDPIGFRGGDVNLYVYVGNNPVNKVDPSGLFCCEAMCYINYANDLWHCGVNYDLEYKDCEKLFKLYPEICKKEALGRYNACGKLANEELERCKKRCP